MYTSSAVDQLKMNFVAGATGLSVSYACMHPLDTIKTRIQADVTGNWQRVLFSRATIHSLGKGFFVSALMAAGQGGFRYSTYEYSKSKLTSLNKNKNVTVSITSISAIIGDLASSIIKVPREVITAKMQIDHYKSSVTSYKNTSTASYVVRQTLIEEGPKGLFKGFWAIAARDSPFMIILLVTYEKLKLVHPFHQYYVYRNHQQRQHTINPSSTATIDYQQLKTSVVAHSTLEEGNKAKITAVQGILYGGISGFLAGYITTPMDVLRTRMIAQKASINRQPVTVIQMLNSIIGQSWNNNRSITVPKRICNVYHTFFAGSISRSVWWFGVCGIFFPMYETLRVAMSQT
ncbi:mitochondrial carrier domain-containing protein [Mycotypha africana]|uniref:mitochondrial carrier domain-containing protein n=1 Tax=Mycotypha africana TaxID=64632 RepID=UPI00230101B0|nr:mitochondrial carrier domain-containing protein [Mycotypha africana]KAI8987303.1 mitochondrial carrier domain-containing protein [Mycotypha africana]